jgi:RNA polymerase sigma factor (sigma-70 family)
MTRAPAIVFDPLLTLPACATVEEPPETAISELTRGLAAGDEGAFGEFHALYFDRLHRFLIVVARGNEDEAAEALQQTLLRVVRYARRFDDAEAFWRWLKMVARSAARDAGRKRQRYAALLWRFARDGVAPGAEASNEEECLRELLGEAVAELEPEDRMLIECRYFDGMSLREAATRLGISERAAESRLARIRAEIRNRLLRKLRKI